MKKTITRISALLGMLVCSGSLVHAQFQFSNANSRLNTAAFNSGCPVTVIDWNNDGLDDIVRLKNARSVYIEIQRTNNTFETRYLGDFSGTSGWAWGMCVADVDHNGFKDIMAGSSSQPKIMMISSDGMTGTISNLSGNYFVQNCTFADFNNDGWEDLFVCDDNNPSHIYMNDGTGALIANTSIINFTIHPGTIGGDPMDSGNYGSVWTDFDNDNDLDLYIAKCRQSSSVTDGSDPRRVNVMFVNNGDGTFTENAAAYNLNSFWQTWTASFGDIDNDADLDLLLTNHDHESQIMLNDGSGHYTDISATAGVVLSDMTPIQSVMEDFDNDGFTDILVAGSASRFYHNNGNNTFTRINGAFDNNNMESFAIGDLNHDGAVDVYASYANIYTTPSSINDVVWLNGSTSGKHFFNLDLEGTVSNKGAIGARAKIYGAWGVQMREVRTGEGYGTVNTSMLHFGLGNETAIDSVVISWPSGMHQVIVNPQVDQFLSVYEGTCIGPEAVVTTPGAMVLCPGQSLALSAPQGYSYLWSTGETTETIQVNAQGEYNVRVASTGSNACASVSRTISVSLSPDETPSIAAIGETTFCNGGSVTIQAPAGLNGYSWSNGATGTNTIEATQTGSYTLTIQGACSAFTSSSVSVTALSPSTPVADDVTLALPATATLTATGDSLEWYDAPGGNLLGTGASFETPVVNTSATYYVVNVAPFGGGLYAGGLPTPLSNNQFGATTSNAKVYFDVLKASTLRTFTVYTDTPGARKFDMYNAGGTLLNSATATLVTGANVVTLNFDLQVGTGYYLMTDASFNQALLGQNSPRLHRENNAGQVAYPYLVSDLVSITSNQFGAQYYFYYFDLKIEQAPVYCSSDAHAVTVTVDNTTGINTSSEASLSVYPNPADQLLSIRSSVANGRVSLMDATGRIVKEQTIQASTNMNVSDLSAGVYMLRVASENSSKVMRVVIQ
ncbi:MAG: hypothetical protein RLZZ543_1079 [Bacteroidota bacterium]|jgi:hypothetical protein